MKRIIDIPRPTNWDEWLAEWKKRDHLADLLMLLEFSAECAKSSNKRDDCFRFLLQIAEGNTVGASLTKEPPKTILANKAFCVLTENWFFGSAVETLIKPDLLAAMLHFFRPNKFGRLENIMVVQGTEKVGQYIESLCWFLFYGLSQVEIPAESKIAITASRPQAVQILHALGRLKTVFPGKSAHWNIFDPEVIDTLKKLAKEDCGEEVNDIKNPDEMIRFACHLGSTAAMLYLLVKEVGKE